MDGGEGWIVAFTAGVAGLAVLLILPPGIALAWLLARHRFPGKALVETVIALPLVIPPVATGLILLKLLGRRGALGRTLHERFDFDVVFTWRAVVIAMAVMSFPLLVRTARVAFEKVDPMLEKSARTLGAGRLRVFCRITLPLASGGVAGGTLLAFARALGEFGATILVAGNIPGRTTTLSLAIYNLVQLGKDDDAFRLLAWAVGLAFLAVWCGEAFMRRSSSPEMSS
ncbi:MAG: molybdate transport system permease protein [Acidobacteriota bacterium]|jgi:molybdate transport system permease protein|nr:molybdate transport system permease protein [Acidobacteriota bacterium]